MKEESAFNYKDPKTTEFVGRPNASSLNCGSQNNQPNMDYQGNNDQENNKLEINKGYLSSEENWLGKRKWTVVFEDEGFVNHKLKIVKETACENTNTNINKIYSTLIWKQKENENIDNISTMISVKRSHASEPQKATNVVFINVDYKSKIIESIRKKDVSSTREINYMKEVQNDISSRMRKILIDWLIDVHTKFLLKPETLYKTVYFLDRFLSKEEINRTILQLVGMKSELTVGITALFIAAKTEEIYPPNLNDFIYVWDNAYMKHHFIDMEAKMLVAADFNLIVTSSLQMLNIYADDLMLNENEYKMCKYFMDYTLTCYGVCGVKASISSASGVLLSLLYFNYPRGAIQNFLNFNSVNNNEVKYTAEEILKSIQEAKQTGALLAIERKYSNIEVWTTVLDSLFIRLENLNSDY